MNCQKRLKFLLTAYKGSFGERIFNVDKNGNIVDGICDENFSLLREYNYCEVGN